MTLAINHETQAAEWKDSMVVAMIEGPKTWRLLKACTDGDGNPDEEMVWTLRGVVADKNLPPLTVKPR